jgi:hypothetical protein
MKTYRIERYSENYFSVVEEGPTSEDDVLICVTVYKKGALEVKRRLDELEHQVERLKNESL